MEQVTPLLRRRNYLLWLAGDTAQQLGLGLGSFAMPLLALVVSGSPTVAGTVGAATALGGVIGFLPGGVLADRLDRRTLRSWSAGIGLTISAAIAVLAALGLLSAWALAGLGFLLQLRASLLTPASEAMLRSVVDKRQLPQAVANNQGRDAAVGLVSGPLGGVLFAIGHAVAFVAQAASFVAMWATNRAIDGEHRAREAPNSAVRDFLDGVSFVVRARLLVVACGAFMLLNLGMYGVVLATIYSLQLAGHRPEVIGLVTFALGLGALLGSIAAGHLVKRVPTGVLVLACTGLFTVAMLVVTAWPWLGVALPALGLAMLTAPAGNAAIGGLLMYIVPNEMLGRVESVVTFFAGLMMPLAPALAGWGLGLVGLPWTYAFFAVLGVVATVICFAYRPIRTLPRMDRWDEVRAHDGERT